MVGVAGAAVLRYASAVLAARVLGPAQYGLYTLGLATTTLAGTVALAALDRGLLRYVAVYRTTGRPEHERAAVAGAVILALVFTVLVALAVALGADHVAGWFLRGRPALAPVLRVFAATIPALGLVTLLTAVTDARTDMRVRVIIDDLFRNGLFLAVVVVAAVRARLSAADLAAVTFGTAVIAAGAALWVCRDYFRRPIRGLGARAREVLAFSLPFLLFQLITRTDQYVGVFLLGLMGTSREVGIFGAATVVATVLGLGIEAVVRSYAPIVVGALARGGARECELLLRHATRWSIIWAAPFAAAFLTYGDTLLGVLGRGYRAGSVALTILTLGMCVHAGTGPVGMVLNMAGKGWINVVNGLAALGVRIALGLWLIPRWGVVGAAVASSVALGGVNLARLAQVRVGLGIWGFDRACLRPAVVAAAAAGLAWLLTSWWNPAHGTIRGITGSAALLGLYGAGLWLYGLDRSDRAVLSAGLRRLRRWIGAAASLRAG